MIDNVHQSVTMTSVFNSCGACSTDSCSLTSVIQKTFLQEVDLTSLPVGTKFNGDVTVTGDLHANNLVFDETLKVNVIEPNTADHVTVNSSFIVNDNFSVSGTSTLNDTTVADLTCTGNTSLQSTSATSLSVSGTSTLNDTTVGDLTATGNTSLQSVTADNLFNTSTTTSGTTTSGSVHTDSLESSTPSAITVASSDIIIGRPSTTPNLEIKNRNLAVCDANGNGAIPPSTTDPRDGYVPWKVWGDSELKGLVKITRSQNYQSLFNSLGPALQITNPDAADGDSTTIQLGKDFVSQNNSAAMWFHYDSDGSVDNKFIIDTNGNQYASTNSLVITMPPPPGLGNVGIHNSSPEYPLDVKGSTVIRNITSGQKIFDVDVDNAVIEMNANDAVNMFYLSANPTVNSMRIGYKAGATNQNTSNAIAIGYKSGEINQSSNCISIGATAGNNAMGLDSVAIGTSAGFSNQGSYCVSIGNGAGESSQSLQSVAIGFRSGQTSQGQWCTSMGIYAGQISQGTGATAVGAFAGTTNQGAGSVCIGRDSGATRVGANSTYVGRSAGTTCTSDPNLTYDQVGIGYFAGQTDHGLGATAVGTRCGTTRAGSYSTYVGYQAGNTAVATPNSATKNIGIGFQAAYSDQASNAVAIGTEAGKTTQGANAIAIGNSAGITSQGANAIAIGQSAGATSQHANSIVLNATGSALNTAAASALYVNPIRNASTSNALYYDTTTKEVTYGAAGGGGGSGDVYSATYTLTRAELLALHTTPVTVIPAPGAGKVITVIGLSYKYTYDTSPLTGGQVLILNYAGVAAGSATYILSGGITVSGLTSSSYTKVNIDNASVNGKLMTAAQATNQPVNVNILSNTAFTGGGSTNTSVTLNITYVLGDGP